MNQVDQTCMGSRIATKAIRVQVTTDDWEIDGYMHIKPGGYQSRISDLLNLKELHFIPITQATCRSVHRPDDPPRYNETMLIRRKNIKMVVPLNSEGKSVSESQAYERPAEAGAGGVR